MRSHTSNVEKKNLTESAFDTVWLKKNDMNVIFPKTTRLTSVAVHHWEQLLVNKSWILNWSKELLMLTLAM